MWPLKKNVFCGFPWKQGQTVHKTEIDKERYSGKRDKKKKKVNRQTEKQTNRNKKRDRKTRKEGRDKKKKSPSINKTERYGKNKKKYSYFKYLLLKASLLSQSPKC